jgi:hypothetical protein
LKTNINKSPGYGQKADRIIGKATRFAVTAATMRGQRHG